MTMYTCTKIYHHKNEYVCLVIWDRLDISSLIVQIKHPA